MKNVQISFDEDLLNEVDRFASLSKVTRSAVIRDAIKYWLKDNEIKEFEANWIRSLQKNPDNSQDAEDWVDAQDWSEQ